MTRQLMVASVLSVLVAPAAAQEQPDTFRLREIVVTAARLPTTIESAPGAVTVISGDDLRANGIRYAIDALRLVPGISIAQTGGPGGLTSLFMRGGEADYVQVLVDGVKANDPGGSFNWAHLRADDIERIEVVRGPASVLYGSDAVSGVVQVFTRAGGPPRIEVGASSGRGPQTGGGADGTHHSHAFDAGIAGSSESLLRGATVQYGATFAHNVSNGLYAFNSDYDNTGISARLGIAGRAADIAFTARRGATEFHYPTSGGGIVADENQFAAGRTLSFGADAGAHVLEALELRVLATSHDSENRTENPPDNAAQGSSWNTSDVSRRAVDVRANAFLPRGLVLTAGAAREWQHGTTAFESISSFGTFSDETDDRRGNTGWYAQLHGTVLSRLVATVGARIDDNDTFGTFATGRAAANVRVTDGSRVRAAIGTAFKEPTFYENFATGFVNGNPDLEPEESLSWEVGAEHAVRGGRAVFGATWFDQRFTNMIQYTGTPIGAGAPNYHNVGSASARGLELTGSLVLDRTSISVTDDGFGDDRAFQDGRSLLRRPEHQGSARATVHLNDALRATAGVFHTGSRDDLDFTDPNEWQGIRTGLPAYTTLELGVEYGLLRRGTGTFDLSVGVRNVFDTRYEVIYNFPAPGRMLQLGVRAGR
jgi:vitamin B12 transporter